MNISIIIFCFNEVDTIEKVVRDVCLFLEKFSNDFEIILVNDGSTDGTTEKCREIAHNQFVKLIEHKQNLGIGQALKSGYGVATKEYVCAIPGDGQFDIIELSQIRPFETKVYYSFYRQSTDYTFYRALLTRLNRLFNQHFNAVYMRDVNWIKVYRKEHLQLTKPELVSSLIESEICAKLYKCGIHCIEIPSEYKKRISGEPKGGSWKTLKQAILDTFKLWLVVQRFKPIKTL